MTNFEKKYLIIMLCFVTIFIGNVFAQAPDTINVEPGFNTLKDAIAANPNKVLRLARGGVYTVDSEVEINTPTIIVGETEPYETPPALINRYTDPGQAEDQVIFQTEADLTFRNIGMVGFTVGDEPLYGLVRLVASNITLTIDKCQIQSTRAVYWGGKDSLTYNFTNNFFWGLDWPGWWNGGYLGAWAGDNNVFNFKNNTVFIAGRVLDNLGAGPHGPQTFDHNTYVNVNGELYYIRYNDDFIVKNNIMYNVAIRGYVGSRSQWGYGGDYHDDVSDSLEGNIWIRSLANMGVDDYARNISVNNNLRFTTQAVFDHQKETTAAYQPMRNDSTKIAFETYGWRWENNWWEPEDPIDPASERIDPQFVTDVPPEAYEPVFYWNWGERDSTKRDPNNWPPDMTWYPINPATGQPFQRSELIWPIPLNFKPQNQAVWTMGDDGYPLGDLNWFGPEVVEAWEAGKPNPLTSVNNRLADVPAKFMLKANYPNPFNPSTNIEYQISENGKVALNIYDVLGQKVRTLVDEIQPAGSYRVQWDGRDQNGKLLPSGIYFYELRSGNSVALNKMSFVR